VIRNIRQALVEYSGMLWDGGYRNGTAWSAEEQRPTMDDFYNWRDLRVMDEIHWYGWYIDYWMEGGLLRDVFSHQITAPRHWNMLMQPTKYTRAELDYSVVVGDGWDSIASFDPHCRSLAHKRGPFYSSYSTSGCEPVAVISAEKLREGPEETEAIAIALLNDKRMRQHVITQEVWDCIWREVIVNKKGGFSKAADHVTGSNKNEPNFSSEMLEEMISQLDRLIKKYRGPQWRKFSTADRIVSLLVEHRALLQVELNEVVTGVRKLTNKDYLGPKERARRREVIHQAESRGNTNHVNGELELVQRELKTKEGMTLEQEGTEDYSDYFNAIEGDVAEKNERSIRQYTHLEKDEATRLEGVEQQLSRERELASAAQKEDYSDYFNAMEGDAVEKKERRTRQYAHLEKDEATRLEGVEQQLERERELMLHR